ncbi:unnamed protein product, partial [Oncorhynchus mykiss]
PYQTLNVFASSRNFLPSAPSPRLTNDESRQNWETYGNPDGPKATSFGIALPAWIVDSKNSMLVCILPLQTLSLLFSPSGYVVVSVYTLQWRPDSNQHDTTLHALHVQDAQHEHETVSHGVDGCV